MLKKCGKIKQNISIHSVAKKNLDGATKFYFLQPNENLGCNIATSENSQIHTLVPHSLTARAMAKETSNAFESESFKLT